MGRRKLTYLWEVRYWDSNDVSLEKVWKGVEPGTVSIIHVFKEAKIIRNRTNFKH